MVIPFGAISLTCSSMLLIEVPCGRQLFGDRFGGLLPSELQRSDCKPNGVLGFPFLSSTNLVYHLRCNYLCGSHSKSVTLMSLVYVSIRNTDSMLVEIEGDEQMYSLRTCSSPDFAFLSLLPHRRQWEGNCSLCQSSSMTGLLIVHLYCSFSHVIS